MIGLGKYKKWLHGIVLVGLFLLIMPHLQFFSIENIVNYAPSSIPLAALVFLLIYTLKSVVMVIPIPVLYISAGIVFPLEWAVAITYLGLIIALSIGYVVGKRLGENKVNRIYARHQKIAGFLDSRKDNLSSLCFTCRVLPVPFDLFSMFCGALKMPFGKYIFVSLLGLTPKALPFIFTGASIGDPLSIEFLAPFSISFIIMLIVFNIYQKQNEKIVQVVE